MFAKVQLAAGDSWHGTSGAIGVWAFYQQRVVPGWAGWFYICRGPASMHWGCESPPRGGTLVKSTGVS